MKRFSMVLVGALIISSGASVFAADDAEIAAAVEARQAHMKDYGKQLGILGNMAQGKADYDAEAAASAADALVELTKADQSGFWLPGSDNTAFEKSRALPGLWAEDSKAMEYGADLSEAAMAMAAVAGDGLDGVKANLGAVGGACGACHKAYRAPEK
ncbi:c-type cytochrome [Falsihalocynthiibacter sp. SS001]|uniref:c-type cytochrome n=1 Tax=Falsihalocynthiibacter sp. SS001 TaxID=3349698 RepID=UPI0036D29D25